MYEKKTMELYNSKTFMENVILYSVMFTCHYFSIIYGLARHDMCLTINKYKSQRFRRSNM